VQLHRLPPSIRLQKIKTKAKENELMLSYHRAIAPVFMTVGLCLSASAVKAQSFADDFSSSTLYRDFNIYTNALANPDTVANTDDTGLRVNIIHSDPTGEERAAYELNTRRASSSVKSTGQFTGDRPTVGTLRYESQGRFYNSIADGGLGEDSRAGDVEIELTLILGTSPEEDFTQICFFDRDTEGNSQPLEATRDKCESFQITELDVNTPYTLEVGIDRATQELYGVFNDERIAVTTPTPFYEANDQYAWARFRVRDGAESGSFLLSSLSFDGESVDFAPIDTADRYKTDDFDDFRDDDNRSKEIIDGRLRMSATVASSDEDNVAFLRFAQPNDYIEADLIYSSESAVDTTAGGFAAVRIAGLLYNDTSAQLDVGELGSVFAAVMLINNADSGLVGEYCAIRSDAEDFSASTDLADGMDDNRCPTFELAVSPDTIYNASLSLDQDAKTITFQLGGEVIVYNITTDVYKRTGTLRAQARMAAGATGTIVGYYDNLRNDPNALTDEELAASMNGTGTSTSSSGGGCTFGAGNKDYSMLMLLLAAILVSCYKQSTRRKN